MATYIALLHKDTDSDFGVTFPDFPGCISAASDLDSLRRSVAEALALHIEGIAADGRKSRSRRRWMPTPAILRPT